METARQSRKQTADPDPADHVATDAVDNAGTGESGNSEALAQLVWKYLAKEISEIPTEVQKAPGLKLSGLARQLSHRK